MTRLLCGILHAIRTLRPRWRLADHGWQSAALVSAGSHLLHHVSYRRRNDWLLPQKINPHAKNWQAALRCLPDRLQHEFHATFSREFLEQLDKGYGACVLRRNELAQIVANSLQYFDGQRYRLGDFVVMPNHVHLLVGLLGATDVEEQCYSWKKFTATQINRELNQTGEFWQAESFDHLVRSPEQFKLFQRYIAENGAAAGLRNGEYLHRRLPK